MEYSLYDDIKIPRNGCLLDERKIDFNRNPNEVLENIWCIGGERGWYHLNWLWKIRGILDKLVGGVGLRRGRKDQINLKVGDPLDFWRVIVANKKEMRLLLFADMKLPGDAWLEFKIIPNKDGGQLRQTASFRPFGFPGKLYWYALYPFHVFVFRGMVTKITEYYPSN